MSFRPCIIIVLTILLMGLPSIVAADPGLIDVTAPPYNANGYDSLDDTAAIQAALNAVPAGGAVVYIPRGVYILTSPLTLRPEFPVTVRGAGIDITVLRWDSFSAGIVGNMSFFYASMPVTVSDITLATTVVNSSPAITINFPDAGSIIEVTARIFNVSIRPEESTAAASWHTGILLDDAWNAHINDVFIHGCCNLAPPFTMQYGIRVLTNSVDVVISKAKIYQAQWGIHVGGTAEGTVIDKSSIVYNDTGITMSTTGVENVGVVTNSFISSSNNGILLINRLQPNVTGNVIYQSGESVASGFVGIYLTGISVEARVSHNVVSAPAYNTSVKYGVVADTPRITMTGNSFSAMTYGVWLTSSSSGCTAIGNISAAGGGITIIDQGSNNIKLGNNPS